MSEYIMPKKRKMTDAEKVAAAQTIQQVSLSLHHTGFPDRGITPQTDEYFGVKSTLTQMNTVERRWYPYHTDNGLDYKCRVVDGKQFFNVGEFKNPQPFGLKQALLNTHGALIITEGEEDCLVLWQAIREYQAGGKYADRIPAVISVPGANPSKHILETLIKDGSKFREIILVLDNDDAGIKASEKLCSALMKYNVKTVSLPLKDPCEMYIAGKGRELAELVLFRSQEFRPQVLVESVELLDKLDQKPEMGLLWPWEPLNQLTYGIQPGGIYTFGAGVGGGKTSCAHNIIKCLIDQRVSLGLFFIEEPNIITLRNIASIIDGKNYNSPETVYNTDTLKKTVSDLGITLGKDGKMGTWSDIVEAIHFLCVIKDVKVIFIDPISGLVDGMSPSEANTALSAMQKDMELIGLQTGCAFIQNSHLNPPESGKPHEEGGRVRLNQFTGSRAMMRKSHACFGIERDTTIDGELGFISKITSLKRRGCNELAPKEFYLKYDPTCNRMTVCDKPVTEEEEGNGNPFQPKDKPDLPWE